MGLRHVLLALLLTFIFTTLVSAATVGEYMEDSKFRFRRQNSLRNVTAIRTFSPSSPSLTTFTTISVVSATSPGEGEMSTATVAPVPDGNIGFSSSLEISKPKHTNPVFVSDQINNSSVNVGSDGLMPTRVISGKPLKPSGTRPNDTRSTFKNGRPSFTFSLELLKPEPSGLNSSSGSNSTSDATFAVEFRPVVELDTPMSSGSNSGSRLSGSNSQGDKSGSGSGGSNSQGDFSSSGGGDPNSQEGNPGSGSGGSNPSEHFSGSSPGGPNSQEGNSGSGSDNSNPPVHFSGSGSEGSMGVYSGSGSGGSNLHDGNSGGASGGGSNPQGGVSGSDSSAPDASAAPSTITAAGQKSSVGPSAAIAESVTYSFLPGQAPTMIVDHGRTISIGFNGAGVDTTTIPIPTPPPHFSGVTVGDFSISIAPSEAIIGGSTFITGPNISPTTTIINGQTIGLGPQGIGLASNTMALPNSELSLSAVTGGGSVFSVRPSEAVIAGHTFTAGPDSAPITTVINGQTIIIGPQGIGLASTTVALPPAEPSFSTVTTGGLTFSVAGSEAITGGHTLTIGSGSSPITTGINGQTIRIGPDGFGLAISSFPSSYWVVTKGDLTLSLLPSETVIKGKTFTASPGSVLITTVINGETLTIEPSRIGIDGTTVALPTETGPVTPSAVTVDGWTFSVEPTDVIISGTTYPIGIGATPTTIVIGNETISVGPGGVGLPSTIIPAPPRASGTGFHGTSTGALSWMNSVTSASLSASLAGFFLLFL